MKFISWNVNGLRACVGKDFESQFKALDADFFCLQETKMQEGQLDRLTDLKSIKDKNITVEEAMVLKQMQNAMKGDLKAFESIIALSESHNKTGEQPKAQETDNAFIEALNGKAAEAWNDAEKE